jgi:hypothetical protein
MLKSTRRRAAPADAAEPSTSNKTELERENERLRRMVRTIFHLHPTSTTVLSIQNTVDNMGVFIACTFTRYSGILQRLGSFCFSFTSLDPTN